LKVELEAGKHLLVEREMILGVGVGEHARKSSYLLGALKLSSFF